VIPSKPEVGLAGSALLKALAHRHDRYLRLICNPVDRGAYIPYRDLAEPHTLACARALLESQSAMTLAPVDDQDQPYATPLFYFPGPDLSLCWLSSTDSRHSMNLRRHSHVSVAVYASVDRWEEIRRVQMEGDVQEVSDAAERREILAGYCRSFRLGTVLSLAIAWATLYRFRASWIRYLDNTHGFGYKVELDLRS
jgi:hypothetical protein